MSFLKKFAEEKKAQVEDALVFDLRKMKILVKKDEFLARAVLLVMDKLPEWSYSKALKVVFNTYVLGDSVMEKKYKGI